MPRRLDLRQRQGETPLLEKPVEGPVYLGPPRNAARSRRRPKGPRPPIHIVLVGKIDSAKEGIRTTFASIPDTPVSKFTLSMIGGKKGLLENSTNICTNKQKVDAKITGRTAPAPIRSRCSRRPAARPPRRSAMRNAKRTATKNGRAGR